MKAFFIRFLIAVLVMPALVHAKSPPTYMQKAISGLIENKAVKRGIPATDPKVANTLQSAGTGIVGAAAGAAVVTVAGATAPAWVTVAATVALGSLFTYGLDLAVDGVKWYTNNNDGTIVTKAKPEGQLRTGTMAYTDGYGNWGATSNDIGMAVNSDASLDCGLGCFVVAQGCDSSGCGYMTWRTQQTSSGAYTAPYFGTWVVSQSTYTGPDCNGVFVSGQCKGEPANAVKVGTPTQAVETLTQPEKLKPVNPALVAQLADKAWQLAAAQPGYNGVPYEAADPITATEAQALQAKNPSAWPTVAEAVSPQTNSDPWDLASPTATPDPDPNPDPDPGTDPNEGGEGTKIDWSIPDTGATVPKLEVPVTFTPTLFSAPTGCPANITFTMFEKQHSISYSPFCDLMTTVAPIFLALGAAAAALIFAQGLKS